MSEKIRSELDKQLGAKENTTCTESCNAQSSIKKEETITPDKKDYKENPFGCMEALKSKNRRSVFGFKRREALNKGWTNDSNQMKMDKFLIPKSRTKAENSKFLMMGWSDSYSCMPESYNPATSSSSTSQFRSKKRINKLIGKQQEESLTRSRISSKDFSWNNDEFSNFSTLQEIKQMKRDKINSLKTNDMFQMSAWDEDSALSVQSHLTRRYRKRKAVPLTLK